jgi:acyl dehydratase
VTRLNYDEIDIGSEVPERRLTLTRADLVKYAGASGEFNPVHHDEPLVQAAGMPSVFGHGMFSMGFLCTALADWAGPGHVTRVGVRVSKQTWPGETLVTRVVVTGKREDGDRRLVDVDCTLASTDGEQGVVGTATPGARLIRRAGPGNGLG